VLLQVFDDSNPYLQYGAYDRQLQNLRWLLGLPFEVTVRIDTKRLQLNTQENDLQDVAAERDVFFATVHASIAIDVLRRMLPGIILPSIDMHRHPVVLLFSGLVLSVFVGIYQHPCHVHVCCLKHREPVQ